MTKNKNRILAASGNENLILGALSEPAGRDLKKVSGVAYSGGIFSQWWGARVITDLSGMEISAQVPLLYNHYNDPEYKIGEINCSISNGQLNISGGGVDPNSERGKKIIEAGKLSEWQLSHGAEALAREILSEGQTKTVNGREVTGPITIITRSKLREVSVCAVGADSDTHLRIAASFQTNNPGTKGVPMKKELVEFIRAKFLLGADCDETAIQAHLASVGSSVEAMEAEFNASKQKQEPAKNPAPVQVNAALPAGVSIDSLKQIVASAVSAAMISQNDDEVKRINDIRALCGEDFPDICAKAVSEKWTLDQTKDKMLEQVRASRPTSGNLGIITNGTQVPLGRVIEASALMAGGLAPEKIEEYTAPVIEAAQKRFRSGMSLQRMLIEAARANGYSGYTIDAGNWSEVLMAAKVQAAYSNVALPGIMSNIANKFLLTGFNSPGQTWRAISSIGNVKDFKAITSYRLGADFKFQKVAPTGELKHGSMSETSYTNQADTYGMVVSVTRKDIINDDLGALTRIPELIGIGAAQSFNEIFWTEFMDNSAFFTTGNKNLVEGTSYVLSIDGLKEAVKTFRALKDENGVRFGVAPSILLVPSTLEPTAEELYSATQIIAAGVGSSKNMVPNTNIYTRKFQPVVSEFLDDSDYTGYSTTAWYLFGNPAIRAAIQTVFLNGVQSPRIESSETEFDTIGVRMRGYMDWGVKKQDPKAGVKVTGVSA